MAKKKYFVKRRDAQFTAEGIEYIDDKDIDLIREYVRLGKILPRRVSARTDLSAQADPGDQARATDGVAVLSWEPQQAL